MKQTFFLIILLFLMFGVISAQPYSFSVRHEHALGSCKGILTIGHQGIQYQTPTKKDQREWKYRDIQQIQLLSQKSLAIVTYEDQNLKLGADKRFKFEILAGEISNDVYQFLLEKTNKPIVTKIAFIQTQQRYQIAAKHLRPFGGSQGTLIITPDGIVYQTTEKKEPRTWRYNDIESIGPMEPFRLRITTNENSRFHYAGMTDFNFALKEKLDEKVYEYIWERIHNLRPMAPSVN